MKVSRCGVFQGWKVVRLTTRNSIPFAFASFCLNLLLSDGGKCNTRAFWVIEQRLRSWEVLNSETGGFFFKSVVQRTDFLLFAACFIVNSKRKV